MSTLDYGSRPSWSLSSVGGAARGEDEGNGRRQYCKDCRTEWRTDGHGCNGSSWMVRNRVCIRRGFEVSYDLGLMGIWWSRRKEDQMKGKEEIGLADFDDIIGSDSEDESGGEGHGKGERR
jgi:hypothetical protein